MHSKEMSEKILKMAEDVKVLRLDESQGRMLTAMFDMGPGCLFDDCENEEQVKGAMIVLEWFHAYLRK